MKMWPLNCASLEAVGWQDGTLRLRWFAGKTVDYEWVEKEHFTKLMAAPSPRKYFQQHIRGKYEAREALRG